MIDARGLSCPIPVVMVQKEIKSNSPSEFEVLLDAECSVENVTRFAMSQGYTVDTDKNGSETTLRCRK